MLIFTDHKDYECKLKRERKQWVGNWWFFSADTRVSKTSIAGKLYLTLLMDQEQKIPIFLSS